MPDATRHDPTTNGPRCVVIGRLAEDVHDGLLIPRGTRLYVVSLLTVEDRRTVSKRRMLRCVADLAVDAHDIVRGWAIHLDSRMVEFTGETAMTHELPESIADSDYVVAAECDD